MTFLAGSQQRFFEMRRRQLLLSVSVLVGGFAAYGRAAYGQQVCVSTGGTSYLCQGHSNDTQSITLDNASVEAIGPMVVETDPAKGGNGGDAIAISGGGDIGFVSAPGSYVVASGGTDGLSIVSTGDVGAVLGSVLVDTSGYFVGQYGIDAVNYGSGPTTIGFDGTALGTSVGVSARNAGGAGGLSVTAGENAYIHGGARGLFAANFGGSAVIRVDGFVGSDGRAIDVINGTISADLSITTGANSEVYGLAGITAVQAGSGTARIDIGGYVTGKGQYGVVLRGQANAGDLVITSAAGSRVTAAEAIALRNIGRGDSLVAVSGDVVNSHMFGTGISMINGLYAGDATVVTEEGSNVLGRNRGISITNAGGGTSTVSVSGDVSAALEDGIYIRNSGDAPGVAVTVGRSGRVEGGKYGINVANDAGGETDIVIDGDVVGAGGIKVTGQATVTVAGSITADAGHAILFDAANVFDDRLELQSGWKVEGALNAGLGFDTLVFAGSPDGSPDVDATLDMTRVLGFDAFTKMDTSLLELTGSNSGIADFVVTQGALALNAHLAGTDFVIGSGTGLTGTGTAGSFTLGSGVVVVPGQVGEIGTLTAQGSAALGSGTWLLVDIAADGETDRIVADTAAIDGGTVIVNLVPSEGTFFDGQRFVIVDAGSLNGGFDDFWQPLDSLFLDFSLVHTATQVAIEADVTLFESIAATSNQAATARSLLALAESSDPDAQSVYTGVLFAPTIEDAQAAFEAASGEIHAGVPTALANAGMSFSRILRTRAGLPPAAAPAVEPLAYAPAPLAVQAIDAAADPAAPDSTHGLWGQMVAGRASIEGDGTAADLELSLGGIAGGTEMVRTGAGFSAGLAFGYTRSETSVSSSQASVDSGHIGVYGAMESGPLLLTAATHFGVHNVETSREVVLGGVGGTAIADYGAQSLGVSAAARYRLDVGGVTVSPFAGLDAAYVHSQGATETGAGVLNLSIDPTAYVTGTVVAGLAIAHEWHLDDGAHLTAEVSAAYERGFGGAPDRHVAFAGTPGYTLSGGDLDDNRLAIGAELDLSLDSGLTFSGGYRGSFGADSTTHGGQLSIGYRF